MTAQMSSQSTIRALAQGNSRVLESLKSMPSKDVIEAAEQLILLHDDIVEIEHQRELENQLKQANIDKVLNAMEAAGLTVEDLEAHTSLRLQKSTKASYSTHRKYDADQKYVITVKGKEYTWSGVGRAPIAFAQYMIIHRIGKEQLPRIDHNK